MSKATDGAAKRKYTYIKNGIYYNFRYKNLTVPLPGRPGDPAFEEKYERLLAQAKRADPIIIKHVRGTFDFVLDKFYADSEFKALALATQEHYLRWGVMLRRLLGDCDLTATTREMIAEVRNSVSIGQAELVRRFISRLYGFADDRGYVEAGVNRARGLKAIKRKVAGHVPWSDDEIDLMFEYARDETLTLIIIGLCTGQRPGDVEMMTWSQVLGKKVRVYQKKTRMLIDIPMHPVLATELNRLRALGPVSGRIVRMRNGKPIGEGGYLYRMTKLVRTIPNMPHRTPHGARFATAAMLEDAGCTVEEIQAILGHTTYQQAMVYLTRRKAAARAIAKLVEHAVMKTAAVRPGRAAVAAPTTVVG